MPGSQGSVNMDPTRRSARILQVEADECTDTCLGVLHSALWEVQDIYVCRLKKAG